MGALPYGEKNTYVWAYIPISTLIVWDSYIPRRHIAGFSDITHANPDDAGGCGHIGVDALMCLPATNCVPHEHLKSSCHHFIIILLLFFIIIYYLLL